MSTSTSRQPFCVFCGRARGVSDARGEENQGGEAHLEDVDREGVKELVRDQDRELVLGYERARSVRSLRNLKGKESGRTRRYRCDVGMPLDRRLAKARLDETRLLHPLELVALLDEVDRRDGRSRRLREGAEGLRASRGSERGTFSLEEGGRGTHAQDVGKEGASTGTKLDDSDALGRTLREPLRDVPDGEKLQATRRWSASRAVRPHPAAAARRPARKTDDETHLAKDLRDLWARDKVALLAEHGAGRVVAERRVV